SARHTSSQRFGLAPAFPSGTRAFPGEILLPGKREGSAREPMARARTLRVISVAFRPDFTRWTQPVDSAGGIARFLCAVRRQFHRGGGLLRRRIRTVARRIGGEQLLERG